MYKIPSERCHKNTSTTHQHVNNTRFTAKTAFYQTHAKKIVESAQTKPGRSMIAICYVIHLCVQGLRVLHKYFESTLLSSNIRPILFEFCDLQYVHSIQYGTTLHFNTGKDQKDNARVVGHANLSHMLNCNLFSNYSIARCRLNFV